MKKKSLLIPALSALLLLSACQKPKAAPEALTKGQEALLETAQSGQSSALLSDLELPERFSGEWNGVEGYVVVKADAEITLPENISSVPTATVERKSFTQADADKMLAVFTKGSTLYQEQGITKQEAQAQLEHYEAIARGEIPYEHDGSIEDVPRLIEHYKELANTAPDEGERTAAPTVFTVLDNWNDESIGGCCEADGKLMHVKLFNDADGKTGAYFFLDGYGDINNCSFQENEADPGFSSSEAVALGDTLLREIGNGSFVCSGITPGVFYESENAEEAGYKLEYVRTVNGFPIAYCNGFELTPEGESFALPAPDGTAVADNDSGEATWGYERITVYAAKDGIVYFSWQNPYSEPEIKTTDSRLMKFADIGDIFGKMIMVKNSDVALINEKNGFNVIDNIDIDKVTLNLMRIRDKDNFTQGLIVPVWDFWGKISYELEDEGYKDVVYSGEYYDIHLTLNALDGTVIDRETGY